MRKKLTGEKESVELENRVRNECIMLDKKFYVKILVARYRDKSKSRLPKSKRKTQNNCAP